MSPLGCLPTPQILYTTIYLIKSSRIFLTTKEQMIEKPSFNMWKRKVLSSLWTRKVKVTYHMEKTCEKYQVLEEGRRCET
jgi:hypothetical protein